MNYLAHAYLSFNQPSVLAGNMVSDYVKGKKQFDFPPAIQVGIQLHRHIDDFTDHHVATRRIAEVFKPDYRLYSGAFADIVYDYFLANDGNSFPADADLLQFSQQTYRQLRQHSEWFPPPFAAMFPYMESQNWLYNYRFDHGIQKSFAGLARRAAYLQESDRAFELFLNNKPLFKEQYDLFFGSVKKFAADTLQQLLKH
ncbi:MAG: ACP phosphodiesterase [Ferruginibacter sp.]